MDAVKTALNNANMEEAYIHEVVLVGGSTRIPKVQELLQSFFKGREVKKSVNPDEAVAYGAAMLVANVTGQRPAAMQDLMLLEVTPLSLFVEDHTGSMNTIVQRQTPIPMKRRWCWETAYDNQTTMSFKIFEGESTRASDNILLGDFQIAGLPPKPRGEIKFDVTFEIDNDRILHVSAVERSTKKQNSISLTKFRNRLSEKEIEQLLEDAKKLRQQDEKERRRMAAMRQLVDYSYIVRRQLEEDEVRQKTSQAYRKRVLAKCEETIRWADANKEATKED